MKNKEIIKSDVFMFAFEKLFNCTHSKYLSMPYNCRAAISGE